jgi:hypothetical protein
MDLTSLWISASITRDNDIRQDDVTGVSTLRAD